ncbi:flavin-containing monooxygenase [Hoyosella subflava]|uniref:Putative monooxygenase n=1 Tax=Hoyosella subflava (strain DSM 45089 / JCM 17490 / NBRC 109087 / DQS3-9A1) TaxID=443218 RepID=F6ERN3_HOYSD|nr:NAD(P)/FAD-dependent oxidoreductase [Hoyosella subflava]AEF39610.1 putative monooxygenase [Hoyosella subflava DQS3-9A1]
MTTTSASSQLQLPDHEIVIIGAGISGIGTAIALQRAGIEDFVLFERGPDIGGTWRDNTYPGVGVDVPSHGYQFSFHLKPDWSRIFAKGAEVKAYIDSCAERYGIRAYVRLNCEVTSREWDEEAQFWRLTVGGQTVTARFVISAIGPFIRPKPPAIDGLTEFTGTVLQSTSWDHSVDLSGKRVAIIGTGASAVQIVPEIAQRVARLDVYQRTPIWVTPKPDFAIPRVATTIFHAFPPARRLARNGSARAMEAFLTGIALKHEKLVQVNRTGTRLLRGVWYRMQVRDERTRRRLTPDYDFGCKRPATSNTYLRTFNRTNVELITGPISRVTPSGITTSDGQERTVDVLILATGFCVATDPTNYIENPVRGRNGFDLATFYAENRARSYESVSLPGLPNHFIIFGPYGWVGGTWHDLVETATTHITRVIREARNRRATSVEVREEAADRWTKFAQQRMTRSLWALGNCDSANSYYYDGHGDTTFVRPTSTREAWAAARTFSLDDYEYRVTSAARTHASIRAGSEGLERPRITLRSLYGDHYSSRSASHPEQPRTSSTRTEN